MGRHAFSDEFDERSLRQPSADPNRMATFGYSERWLPAARRLKTEAAHSASMFNSRCRTAAQLTSLASLDTVPVVCEYDVKESCV
jgi:hypothetical protein